MVVGARTLHDVGCPMHSLQYACALLCAVTAGTASAALTLALPWPLAHVVRTETLIRACVRACTLVFPYTRAHSFEAVLCVYRSMHGVLQRFSSLRWCRITSAFSFLMCTLLQRACVTPHAAITAIRDCAQLLTRRQASVTDVHADQRRRRSHRFVGTTAHIRKIRPRPGVFGSAPVHHMMPSHEHVAMLQRCSPQDVRSTSPNDTYSNDGCVIRTGCL